MKKNYTTIAINQNTKKLLNDLKKDLESSIPVDYSFDEIINRMVKKFGAAFYNNEVSHYVAEHPGMTDEEVDAALNDALNNKELHKPFGYLKELKEKGGDGEKLYNALNSNFDKNSRLNDVLDFITRWEQNIKEHKDE